MLGDREVKRPEIVVKPDLCLPVAETRDTLVAPGVSSASRAMAGFQELDIPGIDVAVSARLSESVVVHVDLARSPEQVGKGEFQASVSNLVQYMLTHQIESVGLNTRVGPEGALIADELLSMVEAVRALPRVALEIVCHLDLNRSFPFASGLDRLLLTQGLLNMENLVSLDLAGYWDTGCILQAVGTCRNLAALTLREIQLIDTELEYLTDLSNLQKLEITYAKLDGRGFKELVALPLESLILHDQWLSQAGFDAISNLTDLRIFGVSRNSSVRGIRRITAENLLPLGKLTRLDTLICPDLHADPEQLKQLISHHTEGLFPALRSIRGDRGELSKI